jgi:hypothetical protein
MNLSPEKIADLRLKHLEMIQAIVTRMANHSATLKNYCITLITAICGFAISLQRPFVALLAFLPIVMFSLLDTQYLRMERRFRSLFNIVRAEGWATEPDFEIAVNKAPQIGFWGVFFSWSIGVFYLPLALGICAVLVIAGVVYGRFV